MILEKISTLHLLLFSFFCDSIPLVLQNDALDNCRHVVTPCRALLAGGFLLTLLFQMRVLCLFFDKLLSVCSQASGILLRWEILQVLEMKHRTEFQGINFIINEEMVLCMSCFYFLLIAALIFSAGYYSAPNFFVNKKMFRLASFCRFFILREIFLTSLFGKNLFFFQYLYSFNPNHAYWNQRLLFSGNLPGMF